MNKNYLKKVAAVCMAGFIFMTGILSGCTGKKEERESETSDSLTLTMVAGDRWVNALETQFPDIRFVTSYYNGANPSGYLKEHLLHEDAVPDLYISTFWPEEELQKKSLLDLSVYDYTNRFRLNFINDCKVDSSVYLLPGAFLVTSYAYNKTLFEEHGWAVPKDNQELVTLVKQIRREEPDLIPISIPGKLAGYNVQYFTCFSQCGFLKTPAGADWKKRFICGDAKAGEGFGRGADALQQLIDAGAFDASIEDCGALNPMQQLLEREAAIIYYQGGAVYESEKNPGDEFGTFPFFGSDAEEHGVSVNVPRYLGLGKHLGEPQNKKKLENALKVMDWLTTKEGLPKLTEAFDNTVLPLKDSTQDELSPLQRDIYDQVENGYTMQGGEVSALFQDIVVPSGWAVRDALMGRCSLQDAINVMDSEKAEVSTAGGAVAIGTVARRMSNEEAAQFTANLYLDTGLGQLALVHGVPSDYQGNFNGKGGVSGVMFEGQVTEDNCTINVPFNKKFAVLSLTGGQIRRLLEEGMTATLDDSDEIRVYDYFWAGMDVEMKDGKVKNMKYQGTPMEEDALFTVVMSQEGWPADLFGDEENQPAFCEDFPNTTEFFMEWLKKDGHGTIEKPEVLRR